MRKLQNQAKINAISPNVSIRNHINTALLISLSQVFKNFYAWDAQTSRVMANVTTQLDAWLLNMPS